MSPGGSVEMNKKNDNFQGSNGNGSISFSEKPIDKKMGS
jgi:hypothetical protein